MDIVRFSGGLGNQMFQYAFVEALRSKGRQVGCSLGFYRDYPELMPFILNKVFPNVILEEVDDEVFDNLLERYKKIKQNPEEMERYLKDTENIFFYKEKEDWVFDKDVFNTKNCCFTGWWQSEKYFVDIHKKISDFFTFQPKEKKLVECARQIISGNYISVHVRRGDYIKEAWLTPDSYYDNAIKYICERVPNAKLLFFSDDVKLVKTDFTYENMEIFHAEQFDVYEDWYDMYLMSVCKHNIIANSTFSWWGAWLNSNPSKIVIAPSVWSPWKDAFIYCDGWIKM